MVNRIEITAKHSDTRAAVLLQKLSSLSLTHQPTNIRLSDVYTLQKSFTAKELKQIAERLSNPVIQEFKIRSDKQKKENTKDGLLFAYAIETGYLPGVTDNIATTTKELIEDLLHVNFDESEGVYSSQLLLLSGKLTKEDATAIADSLINPLIQRVHIKSYKTYSTDYGMDFVVPQVQLVASNHVDDVRLDVSDDELIEIGKKGIANADGSRRGPLALDLLYMKTIQAYFKKLGRNPKDIELESIAQTWSEHCKHTIFADPIDDIKKGLYKTYIKGATEKIRKQKSADAKSMADKGKRIEGDMCVSVFSDNSGAITFDNKWLITHKVETHNSPSALDPFGGAITGVVGVNRDAIGFGLGAKPVANFYGFCMGDPEDKAPLYKDEKLTQKMLSPPRIFNGVIAGINSGGNCSGIPTPQGFVYFDDRYKGKPLVFAGTVGLIPKKIKGKKSWEKKALPGDLIVVIGGRVGKDGIHGATFSSVALDQGSPATAVQIGDPITQKKLSDAVVKEAREQLLFTSITDNGAGGLSCSVAEMAKECNGCEVDLEKVPLKYPGLAPWEIWISESQERMTLSVPKKRWKNFSKLMQKHGVEATVIGSFTKSGKCIVKNNGKVIMDLDLAFLHDGLPAKKQVTKEVRTEIKEILPKTKKDYTAEVHNLLEQLSVASSDFISSQYDHEVQANSALKPLIGKGRVNGDTSIIRPVLSSQKGVILSHALYPSYSELDPYKMGVATIDSAIRQVIVAGGKLEKIALLDNFCWCSSTEPERLWQLKRSVEACYDAALAYQTPFISGKDSMFNDFRGFDASGKRVAISVPPTLLISSIAVIDDVTTAISPDVKFAGDLVYLLGDTQDELGGSEYIRMMTKLDKKEYGSANVPTVDEKKNKKLYEKYSQAIDAGLIASGISVGRGGLILALLKSAMAGMLGLDIQLSRLVNVSNMQSVLFSESQGRILLTIDAKNQKKFESLMKGVAVYMIGSVQEDGEITIKGNKGDLVVTTSLEKTISAYRKTFNNY